MRCYTKLAIVAVFLSIPVPGKAEPYFQQFVRYNIRARLDVKNHLLLGEEKIFYKNNSPDTLKVFYLHLYPNAYRSKDTAFMKDYTRSFNVSLFDLPDKYRSYLEIEDLSINGDKLHPRVDDTIARVDLIRPLPPGDSMIVEMKFREKIRKHIGRAGYRGDHYDVAQWYPKVVVYDEEGFHLDKFRTGEFYGEFGTFDVFLEVPENYVVAATGIPVEGDPGWGINPLSDEKADVKKSEEGDLKYKTIHFHAENVHDFAWSADPDFVVQDTTWNGISIKSFFRKKNKKDWKDTTLVHGVRALQWLSEKVGLYPYPQLSIVDALLRGGMEYPMLVMDGRASEGLVLHEVGHIYFYGIFGNDERAEAWLDEGFTTFQTGWYMQERYGPWGKKDKWSFYHRMTPQYTLAEKARRSLFSLLRLGYGEKVATRAEDFKHSYRAMVYVKASLMYLALRYVVGEENFAKILHEYFDRWKFHHVREERFQKVCEEVSGMDLDWFFEEWLHTTKVCDYRLDKIDVVNNKNSKGYKVGVTIKRVGEIVMPLEVEFCFEDGSKETYRVNGRLRTITQTFDLPKKPVSASLNPENEIMDIDLSDNFLPRRYRIQINWPGNSYYPEDAYQILYNPAFWYNDVDGLKAGLRLRGSYKNWSKKFNLGFYYGFESERFDFSAGVSKPIRIFGNSGSLSLSGYKMEGRQDATISLFLRRRKTLITPPNHDITIGLNYHELTNERFASPEFYEEKPDVRAFFTYSADPQMDILSTRATFALSLGRKWMGGEYQYEKFSGTLNLYARRQLVPVNARLRFFFGASGGLVPYQQKFYLAGGGPLLEEKRFFLRSPGAVPKDLNYHEGGYGNLRGYLPGNLGVNKLVAANLEVGSYVPLGILGRITRKILGRIEGSAFIDIGRSFDKANPIGSSQRVERLFKKGILKKTLIDAGLGLRARKRLFSYNMTLRLDFPFYLNHPEINGEVERTRYRYLFSLTSAF